MEDIKSWLESFQKIETEVREYEKIITKEAGRYAGLLGAMAEHRDRLHERANEIRQAIESIQDPTQRTILRGVYIEGKTAQQMAAVIGYSEVHTYRILQRGREAIEAAQRAPETPQDKPEEKAREKQEEKPKRARGRKT